MKSKLIGVPVVLFLCMLCFLIYHETRDRNLHIDVEDLPVVVTLTEAETQVRRYDEARLIAMQKRFSRSSSVESTKLSTVHAAEIETTEKEYSTSYVEYSEDVYEYDDEDEYEVVEDTTYESEEDTEDEYDSYEEESYTDWVYSPDYFKEAGRISWGDWSWTWYSERVLPGYGLRIPGRYTDSLGYVRDGDGYLCLASDVLDKGTVVATPFGSYGKVYDCGCGNNYTMDVYVGW